MIPDLGMERSPPSFRYYAFLSLKPSMDFVNIVVGIFVNLSWALSQATIRRPSRHDLPGKTRVGTFNCYDFREPK